MNHIVLLNNGNVIITIKGRNNKKNALANTKTDFVTHASDTMDLLEELLRTRDKYERTGIESHSLNESIDKIITKGM